MVVLLAGLGGGAGSGAAAELARQARRAGPSSSPSRRSLLRTNNRTVRHREPALVGLEANADVTVRVSLERWPTKRANVARIGPWIGVD